MQVSEPRPGRPLTASFEFEAGIIICRQIRDILEGLRFKGCRIEWWESRGWIDRHFIVKGSLDDVMEVRKKILHEVTGDRSI